MHLSERAVDPPGEARSDLDIFLDYARRMDFRDRDGEPLIKWHDPESRVRGLEGVLARAALRLHALTYDRLRGASGIQWPCTSGADGTSGSTRTACSTPTPTTARRSARTCAPARRPARTSTAPRSRAAARSCTPPSYEPSPEAPDDEYPLLLTTGRTLYHFHTRTKTGRAPELEAAAPHVWAELSAEDAQALGVARGRPRARFESRARRDRGAARASTDIRAGIVFVPFHYGDWDRGDRARTASPGARRTS